MTPKLETLSYVHHSYVVVVTGNYSDAKMT